MSAENCNPLRERSPEKGKEKEEEKKTSRLRGRELFLYEDPRISPAPRTKTPLPEKAAAFKMLQQLLSCQGKAKGSQNLRGAETAVSRTHCLRRGLGGAESSPRSGRRPRGLPLPWPCSSVPRWVWACRKEQAHPHGRPPSLSLASATAAPPAFRRLRGRLFVCLVPRMVGARRGREAGSKTRAKLNIDQNLFRQLQPPGAARISPSPPVAKSFGAALTSSDV